MEKNYEIIHLCETICSYSDIFVNALFTHQNELLEYVYDKYNDEITDEKYNENIDENGFYPKLNSHNLKYAIRTSNYSIIKKKIF